MTEKTPAHITLHGKPLCKCEMHYAGLLGPASPVGHEHATCSFNSLAAATRAKREMQRHRYGLRVVRGHCPAA